MSSIRSFGIALVIALGIAAGLVVSCKSGGDLADLVEAREQAASARLIQYEGLGTAAGSLPVLIEDRIDLGDRPPIVRDYATRNYLIFNVEDITGDLARMPTQGGAGLTSSDTVASVLRVLTDGTTRHHGYDDEVDRMAREFDLLERARYVLVIKTTSAVDAEAIGTLFVGGSYQGEAHLWDLDDEMWLGGYRFSARDDRASTTVQSDRNASAAVAEDFRNMLLRAFFDGLDAALAAGGAPQNPAPQ